MMHNIGIAARSVFAVLAGIAVLTIIAFAFEIPLGMIVLKLFPQSFPDRATLDINAWWMLSQSLYTVPATIFGGYVAAWLAPGRGMGHAIAMAIVQELLIVVVIFEPPHPVPAWIWALGLTVTPVAIIYGGYRRSQREGASHPATHPV